MKLLGGSRGSKLTEEVKSPFIVLKLCPSVLMRRLMQMKNTVFGVLTYSPYFIIGFFQIFMYSSYVYFYYVLRSGKNNNLLTFMIGKSNVAALHSNVQRIHVKHFLPSSYVYAPLDMIILTWKWASCLMSTHWSTLWSNRALSLFSFTECVLTACRACAAIQCALAVPVPLKIPRFQVWGSNPSQGNPFSTFLPPPKFLQWSIDGEYFFQELYRLIGMKLSLESHHKKLPWLGFEPQTWKGGIWCGSGTGTV